MFFLKDSLLVEILEVCKADFPFVLHFFNEVLLKVSKKKKKKKSLLLVLSQVLIIILNINKNIKLTKIV